MYVTHNHVASIDFEGELAPASLEPLAEIGSHMAFAEFVSTIPGAQKVITIDAPIHPGESTTFEYAGFPGDTISGIQMAVGSNDGYALIDALEIRDGASQTAVNHDAGTEENSPLGSGFEGGQPDPSQGEANIENGTATNPHELVSIHPQLSDAIMKVTVSEK